MLHTGQAGAALSDGHLVAGGQGEDLAGGVRRHGGAVVGHRVVRIGERAAVIILVGRGEGSDGKRDVRGADDQRAGNLRKIVVGGHIVVGGILDDCRARERAVIGARGGTACRVGDTGKRMARDQTRRSDVRKTLLGSRIRLRGGSAHIGGRLLRDAQRTRVVRDVIVVWIIVAAGGETDGVVHRRRGVVDHRTCGGSRQTGNLAPEDIGVVAGNRDRVVEQLRAVIHLAGRVGDQRDGTLVDGQRAVAGHELGAGVVAGSFNTTFPDCDVADRQGIATRIENQRSEFSRRVGAIGQACQIVGVGQRARHRDGNVRGMAGGQADYRDCAVQRHAVIHLLLRVGGHDDGTVLGHGQLAIDRRDGVVGGIVHSRGSRVGEGILLGADTVLSGPVAVGRLLAGHKAVTGNGGIGGILGVGLHGIVNLLAAGGQGHLTLGDVHRAVGRYNII